MKRSSSGIDVTRLRRVGFYRELPYGDAQDPSLRESLGSAPVPHAREIAEYLRAAPILAVAPMVSYDVLDADRPLGTPSLLTDGVWAWPSDLAHYVERHHLQVPGEFLDHMRARNWQPLRKDEIPEELSIEGLVEMSDNVRGAPDDGRAPGRS